MEFPIVGIGASAGGIETLRNLVARLPEKPGLAFIVVQHRSPDRASRLVDILAKHSRLAVHPARDGMAVQVDTIYVAAGNQVVTVDDHVLRSRSFNARRRSGIDTVDRLFASLASAQGRKAIGVVLSGAGSDGAAGVVQLKQAGGIVLVQDPLTATHDGMPRAAIATGAVDQVLDVDSLARQLGAVTAEGRQALQEIFAHVHRYADVDLTGYRIDPLLRRIEQRMQERRIMQFSDYRDLLVDDTAELETLILQLPNHVTEFFRDPPAWDILARDVIASLVTERTGAGPIRVWTPACSTGEEVYSAAMLLAEAGADFQLLATDASHEIVARASRGQFAPRAVEAIAPERRSRFLYQVDGTYRVKRALRDKLVFAPQRLLSDAPFSDLDLITCRNLLIYLEPQAQQQILSLLHAALRVGGYLFLGSSESLAPRQGGFDIVSRRWRIYRKTGAAAHMQITFPKRVRHASAPGATDRLVAEVAHQGLVERLRLPSVLVDEHGSIVRLYGDTGAFLRLPPGAPTLDVLQVTRPNLAPHLRIAMDQALSTGHGTTSAVYSDGGETPPVHVRVTPLQAGGGGRPTRLLVSFICDPSPTTGDASGATIAAARDALDISIEELDASREELRALNEEFRAVNEQLNLSNEEISDVNEQLRGKIEELETQSHVLSSGHVMTLFLDRELRVRWFTPAIREVFPLALTDIGRPVTELAAEVRDERFILDIHAVLRDGEMLQAEVPRLDGRWYLRQVRPFRRTAEATTGVAITFSDISDRKRAQDALHERGLWLRGQRAALESAVNGATLETSLGSLVRTAVEALGPGAQAAFYLADEEGIGLHHVVGMSAEYAAAVDGFKIGPESLACGLATYTGEPVLTRDVMEDGRWEPWRSMAERFDYRGCWSFPIHTAAGKFIGTLALYSRQPREATERELELAALMTDTAAIIISQHREVEERKRAEQLLKRPSSPAAARRSEPFSYPRE